MGSALKIRDDLTPLELRRWARVESYGRAAARAYGIANALEEMPRADAARLAGMDRQTLRDAVVRYNAKGLEGLHDRPKGYSPRRLTADEEAALAAVIIAGPEPERDGVCAWTRADLCRWLEERFAKAYHPSSMTRVLRRMGFSRQKARPSHPRRDAEAQERFKKGELYTKVTITVIVGSVPPLLIPIRTWDRRNNAARAFLVRVPLVSPARFGFLRKDY